jgi:hypothetical protein
MNTDNLKAKHQSLIDSSNPEWVYILSLRNLVRHECNAHGFLTISTFDAILDWKLRAQRQRAEKHRIGNSADLIQELTGAFWRVKHEDKDKLLDIRLAILLAIPGVGIGVASAIFTLCYPDEYAIIDFRNWKVLYGEDKRQFSQADYKKYLTDMRELAEKVDFEVQELDYLLWKEYE